MKDKNDTKNLNSNSSKLLLYIEAICYAIVIVLVILLNNYGIIYIKMVPLLFLLGVAGNLVFNRSVITSLFGGIVSFCVLYLDSSTNVSSDILNSIFVAIFIGMGEILGDLIEYIYYDVKKIKILSKFKKILVYIFMAIFLVVPILLNGYINGNIFGYMKAKNKLSNYILDEYKNEEQFRIVSADYAYLKYKGYIFDLQNNNENTQNNIYTFIVYLDNNNIQDGYKQKLIEKNNNIIHSNLEDYLSKNDFINKYKDYIIDIDCEYPEDITLKIAKNIDKVDDIQIDSFAKEISRILSDFKSFENYDELTEANIVIKENDKSKLSGTIDKKYFDSGYKYIISSLKEEFLKN